MSLGWALPVEVCYLLEIQSVSSDGGSA